MWTMYMFSAVSRMQLQPTRFGALGIPFDIDNVCGVETFDTLGLTFEMGENRSGPG